MNIIAVLILAAIVVAVIAVAGCGGPECREFILPDGTITGCGEWR